MEVGIKFRWFRVIGYFFYWSQFLQVMRALVVAVTLQWKHCSPSVSLSFVLHLHSNLSFSIKTILYTDSFHHSQTQCVVIMNLWQEYWKHAESSQPFWNKNQQNTDKDHSLICKSGEQLQFQYILIVCQQINLSSTTQYVSHTFLG